MASEATGDQAVGFGDEFIADEILARLPARCAIRCILLSKRFGQLLTTLHFWIHQRRLGAPLEPPHAARLQRLDYRNPKPLYTQFHLVGPTFVIEYAVDVDNYPFDASTCNGLVLVSNFSFPDKGQSSINGVIFNPATKEEARLSLQLPHPGKKVTRRRILGFGYGPSSKVYKALVCDEVSEESTRLMVVSSSGQDPRTVFSSDDDMDCNRSLHTGDGKVYFLMYLWKLFADYKDAWVLTFDVDTEAVTRIATPEGRSVQPTMMFELRGRPCIYTQKGKHTVIWLLTADHRWERLYNIVKESPQWDDELLGSWDCGDGLMFVKFSISGAYLYDLHRAAGKKTQGSRRGKRLAPVCSRKTEYKEAMRIPRNLSDYQPTLSYHQRVFLAIVPSPAMVVRVLLQSMSWMERSSR